MVVDIACSNDFSQKNFIKCIQKLLPSIGMKQCDMELTIEMKNFNKENNSQVQNTSQVHSTSRIDISKNTTIHDQRSPFGACIVDDKAL